MNVFELCGWLGAILVLAAYYMVSSGKAKGDSLQFQLINIGGAVLLVLYTYNCKAYASMIVNIIWVGIGLSTFSRFIKTSRLKLQERIIMKTKTKAFLTLALMAIIAIASPVSANTNSSSELYAQSSDSEDSVYDESEDSSMSSESTTEISTESEESSDEEISEE